MVVLSAAARDSEQIPACAGMTAVGVSGCFSDGLLPNRFAVNILQPLCAHKGSPRIGKSAALVQADGGAVGVVYAEHDFVAVGQYAADERRQFIVSQRRAGAALTLICGVDRHRAQQYGAGVGAVSKAVAAFIKDEKSDGAVLAQNGYGQTVGRGEPAVLQPLLGRNRVLCLLSVQTVVQIGGVCGVVQHKGNGLGHGVFSCLAGTWLVFRLL